MELWSPAVNLLLKVAPESQTDMANILGERVRGGKPGVAKLSLELLGNLGRLTKDGALKMRIVNEIAALVNGTVNELKIPAIEQLGAFGPAAKPVVKSLHMASDNPLLKKAAETALERITPSVTDSAIPSLDDAL
jgi:hypothetical protein